MNAITLTLGGRATSTSRCSNISRFIQHGKRWIIEIYFVSTCFNFNVFSNAEISVVLCNQGLEAIDIERFGRSITIIRKISIRGTSHYLIKNEYGSLSEVLYSDKNIILY
jgi:chromosome segregation ATPase